MSDVPNDIAMASNLAETRGMDAREAEKADALQPEPSIGETDVGYAPIRTLFLSLMLFLVPNPNCIVLYWPSANYLVYMMVWSKCTTNTSGRGSTRWLCALQQKYHLPLKCRVRE